MSGMKGNAMAARGMGPLPGRCAACPSPTGGEGKGIGFGWVVALAAMLVAGCGILPEKESIALYAPEARI